MTICISDIETHRIHLHLVYAASEYTKYLSPSWPCLYLRLVDEWTTDRPLLLFWTIGLEAELIGHNTFFLAELDKYSGTTIAIITLDGIYLDTCYSKLLCSLK